MLRINISSAILTLGHNDTYSVGAPNSGRPPELTSK